MTLSFLAIDPDDAFPNDFKSVACSGTARFKGDVAPVPWILWRNNAVTFTMQNRSPFSVHRAHRRAPRAHRQPRLPRPRLDRPRRRNSRQMHRARRSPTLRPGAPPVKYHAAPMLPDAEPSILERIADANRRADALEREAAYFDNEPGMAHVARTRRRLAHGFRDRADRLRTETLRAKGRL